MRKEITVTAEPRESRGKNEARRLRVKGSPPRCCTAPTHPLSRWPLVRKRLTRSCTAPPDTTPSSISLCRAADEIPVMIVDWQRDPVKETLLHVDLKRIDLTKRIDIKVRVHMTGEAQGVKIQGGLLEAITREVEIECLPDEIPESFTVDVTELMIGQNLRASDIP